MKYINIKHALLGLILCSSWFNLSAQVTIGTTTAPAKAGLLQIKEIEPTANDNSTVTTGALALPRVNLKKLSSLEPCVLESATDYTIQKLKNVGTMVYNLTKNPTENMNEGVYVWNGSEWQYMISQSGSFVFNISPSEIRLTSGVYGQTITDNAIAITWKPTSVNCMVDKNDVLNGGIGIASLPASLSGGNVTLDLLASNITPISQADIDLDPFYEKQSFINFSVSDGTETRTERVTIRQIHYTMIVKGMIPDVELGRTYKAKVSANGNWKVTVSNSNIITNHTTSGVADVLGTDFEFSVTDNNSFEGQTATITFSSVDGKFADQVFTVKTFREYPNSYIITPGSEFTFPIRKAYNVWQDEYGTPITGTLTAELLWQDRPSMISAVDILNPSQGINASIQVKTSNAMTVDTLCTFKADGIKTDTTFVPIPMVGNALVSLKVDGVVHWSWHLWITDYNPDNAIAHGFPENASDSLDVVNGKVYSFFNTKKNTVFMDRNLGAVSNSIDSHLFRGYLYQWGRKDPFPGLRVKNSSGSNSRYLYDIHNKRLPEANIGETTAGVNKEIVSSLISDVYLQIAIHNPMTFYIGVPENDYDWYGSVVDAYDNYLWATKEGKKTIYDPCPKGWRVPEGGYGANSCWYSLPIPLVNIRVNNNIMDLRTQGFGVLPYESTRASAAGTFSGSGAYISHGKAVGPMAYQTQLGPTIANTSYPAARAIAQTMRCVRDEK